MRVPDLLKQRPRHGWIDGTTRSGVRGPGSGIRGSGLGVRGSGFGVRGSGHRSSRLAGLGGWDGSACGVRDPGSGIRAGRNLLYGKTGPHRARGYGKCRKHCAFGGSSWLQKVRSTMAAVVSFRDLDAWNAAMDLVVTTYGLARQLPSTELYGLAAQIRRAAVSIPSNVAEGHAG
ncbi:MAG: four helix bundle protein, partial [Acidobacteriota bacterium]